MRYWYVSDIRKGMRGGVDFMALKFSKAYKNSVDKGKYSNITLTLIESIYVDGWLLKVSQ